MSGGGALDVGRRRVTRWRRRRRAAVAAAAAVAASLGDGHEHSTRNQQVNDHHESHSRSMADAPPRWRCCCCWPFRSHVAAEQKTSRPPKPRWMRCIAALKANDEAATGRDLRRQAQEPGRHAATGPPTRRRAPRSLAATADYRVLEERGPDRRVLLIGARPGRCRFRWCGKASLAFRHRGRRRRNPQPAHRRQRAQRHRRAARLSRRAAGVRLARPRRRRRAAVRAEDSAARRASRTACTGRPSAKGEEASPFGPLIAESAPYLTGHKGAIRTAATTSGS